MDTSKKTIILFSGDFDRVMAALIIANGAAAMGDDVTIFAT
ncbi:MAG TPA: DsrE/DsrF/DrsH-like family protein, partial [Thermoleophilia bacterium]|nr:DsrE/DsrF/DrsH-like family protein [Thermoleophilia bacterium]